MCPPRMGVARWNGLRSRNHDPSSNRLWKIYRRARDKRDERDRPNEMESQSVHVALFSHLSHVTRQGLWGW